MKIGSYKKEYNFWPVRKWHIYEVSLNSMYKGKSFVSRWQSEQFTDLRDIFWESPSRDLDITVFLSYIIHAY